MAFFSEHFIHWLENNANELDQTSSELSEGLLKRIALEGVFKVGVPTPLGGQGGDAKEVIEILQTLASHSLTASFIAWGHYTFIKQILTSSNPYFREHYLNELINADIAGATGLSNTVKYLANLEELNVKISQKDGKYYLNGKLPWVTNVRKDRFLAVFSAGLEGKTPWVIAIPSDAIGLVRSADLEFIALQGANTASLTFNEVELKSEWILSDNAPEFLAQTRPYFLGYQFGLALGLAKRSLQEAEQRLIYRAALATDWQQTSEHFTSLKQRLYQGLTEEQYFIERPKELLALRLEVVDLVAKSLLLELEASGGAVYFKDSSLSFIRRWNEGAFLPVVSPSAAQLKQLLQENSH
ncbi:dehydrogenase [Rodentibacter rarus]|uniref:acyl-CoA dehydrogenase family protein n=1 Tax=Rodentibacter rarus TaxID=1908260 RepID=UPI0009858304|nr:acyl-CoA dehydrogenase family protein [Rodentibacter rarus]OOF40076.1 dehydrogenase [Rodentibacter rarus]